MEELWKTITYSPNYEISNLGNIKNKKTNKRITINYERLRKDNKRARPGLNGKGYYLHRIVAEHFIDNPDNLPEVNHIDGDFYNNRADNLEWISRLNNMRHASENNLIKRYTRKVIITNKETKEIKVFEKVTDCAKYLDCNSSKVSLTCNGKRVDQLWDMKYEKEERKIEESDDIIWKEYPECPKYLVSNTGEVKLKKTNRVMKGSKVNGYRFVTLFIDKKSPKLNRLIHRMVAQTFINNVNNKPVVNHKDTDILNNHVDNLEWVTYKENMNTEETIKNLRKGKNSKKIHQILIETGEIVNTFDGGSDCQNRTGIDCRSVLSICHFYNKGFTRTSIKNGQKTYQKKYIFIFDEDKHKISEFLIIAKCLHTKECIKVHQINKETGEVINIFQSGYEAHRKLNIAYCIINNICNYYKYTDENRPERLKYYHSHKGMIYQQIHE